MRKNISYVLTVGFGAADEAPIQLALDEVLSLAPYRVIVVHDRKGGSGKCAMTAVKSRAEAYGKAGVPLDIFPVDQDETTLRWRAGVIDKAFTYPDVEMVFIFATDFDKLPNDTARDGWRKMVAAAAPNHLVLGDYRPKPGSFKDEFYSLVARPVLEAVFPEHAATLIETGLHQFRTEFFILGREVLGVLRQDAIWWNMDPTTDMALACLRHSELSLEVVDLGSFEDRADTRDPLGELFQASRYIFQLVINRIRLERAAGGSRSEQVRNYEKLIPVIEKALETGRYAIRRNLDRLKENPKVAAFQAGAPWEERWIPSRFSGFSYLLDNPGNSLVTSAEGVPLLSCDVSEEPEVQRDLAVYRRLAASMKALDPQLRPYSFCPLSVFSFHVTLWDGINQANAANLTMAKRAEYEVFASALPASVATPSPILPPPVVSLDRKWTLRLKFKALEIWPDAAALVALLQPADEESKAVIELLEQHRRDLDARYASLGKPSSQPWTPHISCGYFKTSEDASAARRHLTEWTSPVAAHLAEHAIVFSSASLYSFTTMEHFYRHALPAVHVPLAVVKKAITDGTGFLGDRGDQKILITYQYPKREQSGRSLWQPLAPSGNLHYCVTPYRLDVAVFNERAKQSRHFHGSALEFYRVLHGTMNIVVGGEKHILHAGDGIVVAPHAVHEVLRETSFITAVIVTNTIGMADKFASEAWEAPGGFVTGGLVLRPSAIREESGLAEVFQYGRNVRLTAFDERWNGKRPDATRPATRVVSMVTGSMTLHVNGERYELHAGDTAVVFPLATYHWTSSGPFYAEMLTLDCRESQS
ncbi:MAG TPA: cupin domain-containing protein [Bryobacteraceae bacterium]|jgi:quercetin dioxygenase-like cupin family protein